MKSTICVFTKANNRILDSIQLSNNYRKQQQQQQQQNMKNDH